MNFDTNTTLRQQMSLRRKMTDSQKGMAFAAKLNTLARKVGEPACWVVAPHRPEVAFNPKRGIFVTQDEMRSAHNRHELYLKKKSGLAQEQEIQLQFDEENRRKADKIQARLGGGREHAVKTR